MIKIYNPEKVAIISDIHLGVHGNSDTWHDIMLQYANWLKGELEQQGVRDLLILGDIFNDRDEIGVKTIHTTQKFFQVFNQVDSTFNIILLNGNHDSYLRDSSDINSISVFKGWNNITVVDKLMSYDYNNGNKRLTFLPWGSNISDIPENNDILLGHLEVNSFRKNVAKLCEDGIDSDVLLKHSPLTISGHFHLRDDRQYKDGKIIYVGSPYHLNWSDCDSTKGYYVFNLNDSTYKFFENTISPKYIKIKFSDLLDSTKLADIKKIIPNNFIKIVVDGDIDYTKLEKVMSALTLLKPLEISSDFSPKSEISSNIDYETVHLDTRNLLMQFVENIDLETPSLKNKILEEMDDIYNKSMAKVNIETM